jgi:hypothetical protein
MEYFTLSTPTSYADKKEWIENPTYRTVMIGGEPHTVTSTGFIVCSDIILGEYTDTRASFYYYPEGWIEKKILKLPTGLSLKRGAPLVDDKPFRGMGTWAHYIDVDGKRYIATSTGYVYDSETLVGELVDKKACFYSNGGIHPCLYREVPCEQCPIHVHLVQCAVCHCEMFMLQLENAYAHFILS